ncbi:MAG TPA: hypothetical protein PKE06_21555, partial [Flavilitoribacter sp.]|nr:hypothetical protein [Flavilitoribacter sp.]
MRFKIGILLRLFLYLVIEVELELGGGQYAVAEALAGGFDLGFAGEGFEEGQRKRGVGFIPVGSGDSLLGAVAHPVGSGLIGAGGDEHLPGVFAFVAFESLGVQRAQFQLGGIAAFFDGVPEFTGEAAVEDQECMLASGVLEGREQVVHRHEALVLEGGLAGFGVG